MTSSLRRWVALALLAAVVGCGKAQEDKKVVVPVATPEAIALIRDNADRCAKLSQTALTALQAAEKTQAEWSLNSRTRSKAEEEQEAPQPPEPSQVLRSLIEGDAAPDVAAATRASELISRLMPGIAAETTPQVAEAVTALNKAHESLCDSLAQKDAAVWTFERNRRRALDNFEKAEAQLEALYQVNPTDMQFAMRKYNPLLEQARSEARRRDSGPALTAEEYADERAEWEALQELQTVQQAEHDIAVSSWREEPGSEEREERAKVGLAPDYARQLQETPESRQRKFQAWYPSYAARATPVKQALAHYVDVRLGPASQVQPACQSLLDATSAMLNDPNALQVPDKVLPKTLKGAYENLRQSASACLAGRTAEAAFRMTDYDKGIKEATAKLSQYSIMP
ncbi:MAG TPA: hypothetical protein VIW92_16945 [Thermoanaerobaculia bacterium]